MAIVHFPYGRAELTADLPDEDLAAVLTAQLPADLDIEPPLERRRYRRRYNQRRGEKAREQIRAPRVGNPIMRSFYLNH